MSILATQPGADWGLARISNPGANGTSYSYDDSAGEGTCAYIIDAGVDTSNAVRPRREPPFPRARGEAGNSMASPHVAGLGAYLLGTGLKVQGLCEHMATSAIKGAISGVPSGTVNLLINNGFKKQTRGLNFTHAPKL